MSNRQTLVSVFLDSQEEPYPKGSIGHVFSPYLLSIHVNYDFWKDRLERLVNGEAKSGRFKRLQEENSVTKFHGVCHVAYFMQYSGKYKWVVPDNADAENDKDYWDDVWKWCSITGEEDDKPDTWYRGPEDKKI